MTCSTRGITSASHAQAGCSALLSHSEHRAVSLNTCVEDTTVAMELGGELHLRTAALGLQEADLSVSMFGSRHSQLAYCEQMLGISSSLVKITA